MAKGMKTGGRVQGTPNKLTSEMREALKTILNREIEILPRLLEKMKPEKRAEVLSRLLPFIMPKNYNIDDQRNIIIDFRNDD
ncbi:MAG TPA: hypothetical protein PK521_15800 [Bacteroidales bacterium]|nr:hypothetical protein [Bacteroidales bacterium]HQM70770.1 hypothetical protein [Bacteroidales bacterium]